MDEVINTEEKNDNEQVFRNGFDTGRDFMNNAIKILEETDMSDESRMYFMLGFVQYFEQVQSSLEDAVRQCKAEAATETIQ